MLFDKLTRRSAALAAVVLAAFSPVGYSAGLDELIADTGIPAGMQVDVAVFTADGLCLDARHPRAESATRLRFHAASLSKLFTATVVLQLRDEGKLDLRDLVGRYVEEFASSQIRIEDLLTHTSGLRDQVRARGRTRRAQVDEYFHELARQKLRGKPGERWAYADAGFNLLGRVIGKITGQDFVTVMQQRVLAPLGMTTSSFDAAASPADGVQSLGATDERGRPLEHPWDLAFAPSSGLQSDARDLARFGAAILAVAAGQRTSSIVSANTLREMTTVRTATEWSGISQGYGWQLASAGPDPVWRHAGGEAGFESLLTLYPSSGFGIVVMGNRDDWPRFPLESAVARAVREGRLGCPST